MSKVQLSTDIYPDWHFQPLRLERKQIENPIGVVREFFSGQNLPEARQSFKDMLQDAVSNTDAYAADHLSFYDDAEKLVEAAWLLLQNHNKEEVPPTVKAGVNGKLAATLPLVIAAICPQRIFRLGGDDKGVADLMIIVPDRDAKPFKYYEAIVSTACYAMPDLSFSLHTVSSVQEQLSAGSPFYTYSCTAEKEVYRSPDAIPLRFPETDKEKAEARQKEFKITQQKANAFFEAAKGSYESGSFTTALFLLHQAAELALYGLICVLWGREIKEHSLAILYRHIRRLHNSELDRLLSPPTEEEKERLQLLDSSYLKARYSAAFEAEGEQVVHLLKWVRDLLDACNEAGQTLLVIW